MGRFRVFLEKPSYMISARGHTAIANKTSMLERQSLWGHRSEAKQIVENV